MNNPSISYDVSYLLAFLVVLMIVPAVAASMVTVPVTNLSSASNTAFTMPEFPQPPASPFSSKESLIIPTGWSSLTRFPANLSSGGGSEEWITADMDDPFTDIDGKPPFEETTGQKTLAQETRSAFTFNETTGTWYARNSAELVTITYMSNGTAEFSDSTHSIRISLIAVGREGDLTPVARGTVRAAGKQLDIVRPDFTEWYINSEDRVEQGMTITDRPHGTGPLKVRFDLASDGSIHQKNSQLFTLDDATGTPVFVYTGLTACSADGTRLPASLVTDGITLDWSVDDTGAVYPVMIDPVVVPAAKATATFFGGAASDYFSESLSLSSGGLEALIGAAYNDTGGSGAGAAYLFKRPGGTCGGRWNGTTPASAANMTFIGSGINSHLGSSVSLSSDGSLALVGASMNSSGGEYAGAAYLFNKPAGGWNGTIHAYKANATFIGGAADDRFGSSVSISPDGSEVLIAAPMNDSGGAGAGAVYLFEKPAGGWSGSTHAYMANATFIGGAAGDYFGYPVAISSNGLRVLIGAMSNCTNGHYAGAAYLFNKPGGGWSGTTHAWSADAIFTSNQPNSYLGNSVSLSSNGEQALIGAYQYNGGSVGSGAAFLYSEPVGGWNGIFPPSTAAATFTGGAESDCFGQSVKISSDGERALIGAVRNGSTGAAYLFAMPESGWSGNWPAWSAISKFTGSATEDRFGSSTALSSDGTTAFVGGDENDTGGPNAGAGYIFQTPYATLTAGGTKTGVAGNNANGLTLKPTCTLTKVDLYLGWSRTDVIGTAVRTGITLPASASTSIGTINLSGKSAGSYYLVVTEGGTDLILGATDSDVYTVTNPVPTATSLSPAIVPKGSAGTNVTIKGTKFTTQSRVYLDGGFTIWSQYFINATAINLTVPSTFLAHAVGTTTKVQVFNPAPGGGKSANLTLKVGQPVPEITTLDPGEGLIGTKGLALQVKGTNFVAGAKVLWNGVAKTPTAGNITPTQITLWIPATDLSTAKDNLVKVQNPSPGNPISNQVTFSVKNAVPLISSISPTSTKAGGSAFTLVVNGNNFTHTSKVLWNGLSTTTTYSSPTKLTASIPAKYINKPWTLLVTVNNPTPGGGTSSGVVFLVKNPQPAITTLSPSTKVHGSAAFNLTVSGTNFTAASTVQWNSADRTTWYVSGNSLKARIEASDLTTTGTNQIRVRNWASGGDLFSADKTFTVT